MSIIGFLHDRAFDDFDNAHSAAMRTSAGVLPAIDRGEVDLRQSSHRRELGHRGKSGILAVQSCHSQDMSMAESSVCDSLLVP
ncbi:hypothetical protein LCGC14_2023410 [marine sediment metagenome]|uniref:Uncharacterized protein n=1 Tax=marine sediment metagenome TaxID=412755 RepID=A0A0F9EWV5_9ZZZZ